MITGAAASAGIGPNSISKSTNSGDMTASSRARPTVKERYRGYSPGTPGTTAADWDYSPLA